MRQRSSGLYASVQVRVTVKSVERAEALDFAKVALRNAGFDVSRTCASRASCFDFAARKGETLVFVKVAHNIRDVSRSDAAELRTVAVCFNGSLLIVSDVNGEEALSNDTIYSRYGAHVVTSKTLEDIVHGTHPLIEATPGGFYVRTDGGKIRERRHELGLSIGKLALMVGVSRRALYGYEMEMTRASVAAAYQLAETLGVPIAKSINILEANPDSQDTFSMDNHQNNDGGNRIRNHILAKFSKFGLNVYATNRSPFDFAAFCPHTELRIIGGILSEDDGRSDDRAEEITSLSKVMEAKSVLLGNGDSANNHEVAFLSYDELEKIPDRQKLEALLR